MEIGEYVKTAMSNEILKVVDIVPTQRGDYAVLVMSSGFAYDTILVSELRVIPKVKSVILEHWVEE